MTRWWHPDRGLHVLVDLYGWVSDKKPDQIHSHRGHRWVVEEVLAHHRNHDGPTEPPQTAEEWLLRVNGPLPGGRGHGSQVTSLRKFGDGAGWYMLPAQEP